MGRQKLDKTNLGYLDVTYQYKLVKYFIEDSSFFENMVSIVDPNAFTEPALRNFVGIIKDKYLTNSVVPSYEMISFIVKSKAKTSIDIEECDALIHKLKFETSYEGNIEVKDIAVKFFKQQNMIKVANKILDIAGKGDIDRYDECQKLFDDAANAGQEEDFGFSIFDLKEKALSNDYTVSIPTGIKQLDDHVGGGLDKGKLGLLIAPAGFGKAQPLSANILTPSFGPHKFMWKKMGDIKVGDYVLDRNGIDSHKVIGVFPQGVRPIYKVTCQNGASCECDIEHLWNVNGEIKPLRDLIELDLQVNKLYLPEFNFKSMLGDNAENSPLYITKIEYVREEEAQCIMIDSDEHLYVTDNFIVTHNTSFTTAINAYAATYKCDMNNHQGYKVLQIYFEDDDVDITRKHFARITQTEARFMKRLDIANRDEIEYKLMSHPDKDLIGENLRLKHFRSGTKTASDIEVFIKKLINRGFKPDLVTIDYFECIAPEKGGHSTDSQWVKEGVTMRKFENMAKDLNCAIWIATQGNKDSINSPEVVRMDQAGGSIMKVQVAQFIISIARALEDIDRNKAVISILKNRSGKSGKIFNNVKFNNGTCTISCDEVEEYDDGLVWKEESAKMHEKDVINKTRDIASKLKNQESHEFSIPNDNVEGNFVGYAK